MFNASPRISRRAVVVFATASTLAMSTLGSLDARADAPPAPPPPPPGQSATPDPAPPPSPIGAVTPVTPVSPPNGETTPQAPGAEGESVTPAPVTSANGTDQRAQRATPARLIALRLKGSALTLKLRCRHGGSVALVGTRGAHAGARRFACDGRNAAVRVPLSSAVARKSHTRQGVTLFVVVRERGSAAAPAIGIKLASGTARRSGARARSASTNTQTYCEYDSGMGLPICYEYWTATYGPYFYSQYGRWLWAGQATMWLSGEYLGVRWFWSYWNGSGWVYYGHS